MTFSSTSKLDRITHEAFASSLRTWCNSEPNQRQSSTDKYLSWINSISERLLVGSKVDLMCIPSLKGLNEVEIDFLKFCIPNLTYFSKSYDSKSGNNISSFILKKLSGLPFHDNPFEPGPRILLDRIKFKNILLKLLSNSSRDRRISRMKRFLLNPEDFEYSDVDSDSSKQEFDDNKVQSDVKIVPVTPKNPDNDFLMTPRTKDLVDLIEPKKLPKLYIEYVEPTKGLFTPQNVNILSYIPRSSHRHVNCFLRTPGKC